MSELFVFLFSVIASTETFAIVALLTMGYALWHISLKTAVYYGLTVIGMALSVTIIKALTMAPRHPDVFIPVSGYGFPSGHSAGIAFLALTTAFFIRHLPDIWRVPLYGILLVLMLAIGSSRLYYKAHTIPEVLAGYVFGLVWAGLFIYLTQMNSSATPLQ